MSIKSEKAKEILAENVNPIATTKVIFYGGDLGKCDITLRAAKQAIVQAESDADEFHRAELMESQDNMMKIYDKKIIDIKQSCRERAVRAFKMSCNARYRVNCGHGDLQGILMCPEGQDCRSDCVLLAEFLKHYGNEQ